MCELYLLFPCTNNIFSNSNKEKSFQKITKLQSAKKLASAAGDFPFTLSDCQRKSIMAKSKEEREQRRLEAKERSEKRKAVKAAKSSSVQLKDSSKDEIKVDPNELRNNIPISKEHNSTLPALSLPIDALSKVVRYLPAREWGALSLTCTGYNGVLGGCRVAHLCSRLMRREDGEGKQSSCGSTCLVGGLELCSGRKEAMVSG